MDDVRAVMDAVGSERAALIGVSEGGPMSILFAAAYPERAWSLVLMGTYARDRWAPDYPSACQMRTLAVSLRTAAALGHCRIRRGDRGSARAQREPGEQTGAGKADPTQCHTWRGSGAQSTEP
jgi:pimeloyl-ACP methyl ester carboxylesterase